MQVSDYFSLLKRISSHYFLVATLAFMIFYILFQQKVIYKKIQARLPNRKDYLREIGYSVITMIIFAFVPLVLVKNPAVRIHTSYYIDITNYGWFYFYLAFPLLFIIHDTYFYWTHRLMHHKKIFRYVHLVHHHSTNPSPWAAYSFHPLEAVIEAGVFPVMLFTLPVHYLHILIFFFFMIVYNVYGHLGYELYPKGFNKHWFGKWINTSISHNQHHQYFKGNYGLYFTFWDRVMGTLRSDYDQQFEQVTSKKS